VSEYDASEPVRVETLTIRLVLAFDHPIRRWVAGLPEVPAPTLAWMSDSGTPSLAGLTAKLTPFSSSRSCHAALAATDTRIFALQEYAANVGTRASSKHHVKANSDIRTQEVTFQCSVLFQSLPSPNQGQVMGLVM